jgi:tetratricopeptide (TPR) repeat protein
MEAGARQRVAVPVILALAGAAFALLAVVDKVVGLVHHPMHLATLAYACLFVFVGWSLWRGVALRPSRLFRPSLYAATLILTFLTAAYIFAFRLSADPLPVLAWSELHRGDDLLAEGRKDEAHLIYRRAYRQFPGSFPVLMRMGAVSYQVSDYERAQKYYSRAVEVAPAESRWRALNDLGQAYWKLNQAETAIEHYQQARRSGMPESELNEWHYRLAWAYFDAGDYDAAIEHYLVVARNGEKYAAASYYNAACAQARKLAKALPEERPALVRAAVENLRSAWKTTVDPEERDALLGGLDGPQEDRDPDLAPLAGTPEARALVRDLRSG